MRRLLPALLCVGLLLLATAAALAAPGDVTAEAQPSINPLRAATAGALGESANPFSPQFALDWLAAHGLKLAMIVGGMLALNYSGGMLLHRVAGSMTRTGAGEDELERDARTAVIASYLQPVLNALIFLVGGIMILEEIQVPTGPLLAMGSALFAMVAVGFFASWSVLSNAFCSVILLVYQPFTVGSTIELMDAEVKGKVVNFNLLYTTLESPEGELIHVPNNLFFQQPVRKSLGGGGASLDQQLVEPAAPPAAEPRDASATPSFGKPSNPPSN